MSGEQVANDWRDILEGSDRDAFRQLIEPHTNAMVRAAEMDLEFYVERGFLHEEDFTPEEIVGEALLHTWEHRDVKPRQMALKSWLLGTQYRVMRGMVNSLRAYRRDKSLSLDAPVPDNPDARDTDEWFWDWYQPDRELLWEDVIPSQEPADVEVSLENNEQDLRDEADEARDYDPTDAEAEARHVLILHDEFKMSLPEVAFTINRSPIMVAEVLEKARAGLRERQTEGEETEHFAPR